MQNSPANKIDNIKNGSHFTSNNNQYNSTNQYNSNANFIKGN